MPPFDVIIELGVVRPAELSSVTCNHSCVSQCSNVSLRARSMLERYLSRTWDMPLKDALLGSWGHGQQWRELGTVTWSELRVGYPLAVTLGIMDPASQRESMSSTSVWTCYAQEATMYVPSPKMSRVAAARRSSPRNIAKSSTLL